MTAADSHVKVERDLMAVMQLCSYGGKDRGKESLSKQGVSPVTTADSSGEGGEGLN